MSAIQPLRSRATRSRPAGPPPSSHARGIAGRGDAPSPGVFVLALYLATLFLGAGVFVLPLEAAGVGLVPILVMLALVVPSCIWLYRRVAALLVRPADGLSGGGEALGRAVVAAGGGNAGTVLAWLGVAVYVTCAAIAYSILGLVGLEVLAAEATQNNVVAIAMGGVFVSSCALLRLVPDRHVVARRLLLLTLVWGVGVVLIALLGETDRASGHGGAGTIALGLAVFAVGSIVVSRCASPTETTGQTPGKLTPDHHTSVVALRVQLGLMAILVCGALGLVIASSGRHLAWDALWVPAGFTPSDLLGPLGVVLFALVGTGMSNIADYPAMAHGGFRQSVVRMSLIIVAVVLVVWMAPIVLLIGHEGLGHLIHSDTNSAMGLAASVASHGSVFAIAMTTIGALATLIAVTNANAGFISSLSRESIGAVNALRPGVRRMPSEARLTAMLIALAVGAAGANLAGGDTLSSILRIGGITGGGVLVVVLALLAENRERRYRIRFGAAAIVAAVGLGVWATWVAVTSTMSVPLAVLATIVAWTPLIPTVLATRGVIRGPDVGGAPVVPAPVPRGPSGPVHRHPAPKLAGAGAQPRVREIARD